MKSLKEDVEAEILVNEEIDINDITRYVALEKHYEEEGLPVDMGEFLFSQAAGISMQMIRKDEDYGTLTLRKMLPSTSSICLSVIRPISKKISPSNRCGIFRTSSAT